MKKIHVAIMTDDFDPRPERTLYYRRLIEHLITRDDIQLSLVHSQKLPGEPLYEKVREVLMPRVQLPFASRFVSFIRYCMTTPDSYDVVHWLKPRVFPFFWLFPAQKRIIMAHGGGDVLVPGIWTFSRYVFNWTIRLFQRKIHALIAVSEYANKEIIYAYRVPPEKVVTIYNYVDKMYLQPFSKTAEERILHEYGIAEPYFFSISRFRAHKNIGRIVKAFLQYRSENPESRELLVLGGGSRKEFEGTYGALPDSPFVRDIRFLGYIPGDHQPALYRGATALVFISLNEGFGLPIVEAFACKTPVIVSNVTSLPEIAGDAGIVVDPHSTEDVKNAMARIARDENVRSSYAQKGYERSLYFTEEKTFASVVNLYHSLLAH